MKKQNTILKVVAVALVGVLAASAVANFMKVEDETPTGNNSTSSSVNTDDVAWDNDGVLKILAIGNSFSDDSMQYVYQLAKAAGVENIELGKLSIGGCALSTHLSNAQNDSAAYTYYTNNNGTWSSVDSYKMSDGIKGNDWDFISFQKVSHYAGVADKYDDLNALIDIIEPMCTNDNVEFVWHMTWAYDEDSDHYQYHLYDNDQMTMYNAIVSAVREKIVPNERISKIIPNGTAVQNARTSYLGDTLTRDGYHMSFEQGRVLTGVTMVAALVGIEWDNIDFSAVNSDTSFVNVVIESVKNAIEKPFDITPSLFEEEPKTETDIPVDEIDLSNYEELELTLYKTQCYMSHESLEPTKNNNFFTTQKFTKETLPIGSIIVVSEGWQYRPDGWVNDEINGSYSDRPEAVTTSKVLVTEEWWGKWTTRAFNISLNPYSSLESYTEDQIREAFKIYVPKTEN